MQGNHWKNASSFDTTAANSQSQFFKQRAVSQLKGGSALDRIIQKPEDILRNMTTMEQKLKDMGVVKRKPGNQSVLARHKPDDSFSAFSLGERSINTAQVGTRQKA